MVNGNSRSSLTRVVFDRFPAAAGEKMSAQGWVTLSCRSHRRLSIVDVVGMYSRET
jgi:hypothetical protein